MKGAVLNRASEDVATFIVKAYKGGNDDLWALHELNILDKHRLLLPVYEPSRQRIVTSLFEFGNYPNH